MLLQRGNSESITANIDYIDNIEKDGMFIRRSTTKECIVRTSFGKAYLKNGMQDHSNHTQEDCFCPFMTQCRKLPVLEICEAPREECK